MSEADDECTDEREDGGDAKCKFCGERGLIWELHGERWVMTTLGGKIHKCRSAPQKATDVFRKYIHG